MGFCPSVLLKFFCLVFCFCTIVLLCSFIVIGRRTRQSRHSVVVRYSGISHAHAHLSSVLHGAILSDCLTIILRLRRSLLLIGSTCYFAFSSKLKVSPTFQDLSRGSR